ncbi:GntR family transcriptional regulator [Corynebacterium striatum]|uniref:GntR family transcriptional regulator n=1 Tax=Corynebacterium striatum TaxID=43770 RepID=UPI00141A1B23|nr:GntR family transcriptional regulator [Corynebacterium striatum]NHY11240.1 GntR family transcriptional regulator [Corynebacterium striatum]NHY35577.1 GntR family transcriptional regulator [Corynebacterium striatum]HAT1132648.1 GntR family transcriptional regulator [Corynebacterium striatum]HAT1140123.1 GntR family transcriptional regulator [Corynebacterium striatum]HAT1142468.1 GntR family transcriptional regulator [Corynebacterium striatum]
MLSQSVASEIRDAISAGEFMPGQQLSEVKAAERFSCSRNTLREAFTELAAQRLVERIPNRGVFIATPDADYVRDLFIARAAIEPSGVLWGEFADPAALIELVTSARAAQENGEDQEVSNINQRFHRALVASLNSPTLNAQMNNLLARMRLSFLLVIPRYPTLHAEHIEGNIRLAQLIADGKREEAAALLHDSLLRTCKTMLAVI